jgi:hypothetical protein
MNQEGGLVAAGTRGFQIEHQEFTVSPDTENAAARQLPFERGGIFDKVGLTEADFHNSPAREDLLQSAHNRFDFGKLWHRSLF